MRFLFLLLFSFPAIAAPSHIEVWFLSKSKVAELNKLLDRSPFIYRPLTARLQCQQMGDYCFDPQMGLYKPDDEESDVSAEKLVDQKAPSIPSAKSVDRNLIDCDPNNYFDVFCGKARKEEAKKTKLDLWIDTSSSMKEFDYPDPEGGCFRKSLVSRLDEKGCGFNKEVNVMMFDTSLKQAGTMDSLCGNQGLNDVKRLMDYVERSDAKKLVIITDIYELHRDFADFIHSKNGIFKGDKDALTSSQLLDLVDNLAKLCK